MAHILILLWYFYYNTGILCITAKIDDQLDKTVKNMDFFSAVWGMMITDHRSSSLTVACDFRQGMTRKGEEKKTKSEP